MEQEKTRLPGQENWLDNDTFDCVILGTGLVESLVAGALARAGKSVLHLDKKEAYGGFDGSFNLGQINTLLEEPINENELLPPYFTNVLINKLEQQQQQQKKEKEQEKEEEKVEETKIAKEQKEEKEKVEDEKQEEKEEKVVEEQKTDTVVEEQKENIEKQQDEDEEEEEEEEESNIYKVKEKTLEELGRMFSIDIAPTLLYARGALVKLLVSSSASRYLEFKSLDQNYLYIKNKIHQIPSTKGSIFKDSTFSLKEKRLIMKFMESIKELNDTEDTVKSQKALDQLKGKYKYFVDYIKSFQFTELVQQFVLYGLSLIHEDLDSVLLEVGIESVFLYTSSLLVYGSSPFLVPFYGVGDIPQAFCRLCAVFGGTYVLGRSIQSIQINSDSGLLESIKCTEGQTIKTKYLLTSPKYLSTSLNSTTNLKSKSIKKTYSRFIGIIESRILNTLDQSFITIPPNSIGNNKNVINVLQLSTICVPYGKGKSLIHVSTLSTDNSSTAENDLKQSVEILLAGSDSDKSPKLLWGTYFNYTVDFVESIHCSDNNENSSNKNNIFVCSDSPNGQTIDYEYQISQAKKIFDSICPGQIFLEKVPDAEDVIWNYGDEEQQPQQDEQPQQKDEEKKDEEEQKNESGEQLDTQSESKENNN